MVGVVALVGAGLGNACDTMTLEASMAARTVVQKYADAVGALVVNAKVCVTIPVEVAGGGSVGWIHVSEDRRRFMHPEDSNGIES